ncbi:hypothetical protein SD71_19835 [Cohnella kolymensis]|uniref:DUF2627 domain-containing protein n=1 Tax=Cohnella kolymensis TaxID=1590652 RepID=A0ABR4ZZS9_9BACL|nr:DUF2627 domain-containing protein [Cohnella kolymensis]KIL34305.1 hypothetical protein SD71_19835 [Cohnella kolymensis]
MKLIISRLIAVLLLVIPGIGAAYGFLLMKDALYDYFAQTGNVELQNPVFAWGMFILGAILFLCGIAFIGGWTFYRDRKRNYLSSRFRAKRPRPPRPDSGSKTE